MCDFLTGPNHRDRRKISELTEHLSVERHAADALFRAMSDQQDPSISDEEKNRTHMLACDMYSRLLQARSDNDFSEIINIAHVIMGEQ